MLSGDGKCISGPHVLLRVDGVLRINHIVEPLGTEERQMPKRESLYLIRRICGRECEAKEGCMRRNMKRDAPAGRYLEGESVCDA